MEDEKAQIRRQLRQISLEWIEQGTPSLQAIETVTERIQLWKRLNGVKTLWPRQPVMLTATLDDGIGQGLNIIQYAAEMMGVIVNHLGLLKTSSDLIDACRRQQPDLLGLTVLHSDSEAELSRIGSSLPPTTHLIAGGPAFRVDPAMGSRCNVGYVAENAGYFIHHLLEWSPAHAATS